MFTPDILEKLNKTLDKSRISHRAVPGKESRAKSTTYAKNPELFLSYLETHDVIRLANELFGFDGWSCRTISNDMAFDAIATPRTDDESGRKWVSYEVGFKCIVEIQVNGCTRHGTGFGAGKMNSLPDACDLACKAAESDALKRAFKSFGNQFGLELYDKEFLAEMAEEVKAPKAKSEPAKAAKAANPADFAKVIEVPMTADQNAADWSRWETIMNKSLAKISSQVEAPTIRVTCLDAFMQANDAAIKAAPPEVYAAVLGSYQKLHAVAIPEPTMGA